MKIIMVLGMRLLPDGDIPVQLRLQMVRAIELLREDPTSFLVISGGATRFGFPSEAVAAMSLVPYDLQRRTFLETKARSTRQNVRLGRQLIEGTKASISSLVVVCSRPHGWRARFLFRQLWPEILPLLSFENVGASGPREWLIQSILFLLMVIDPQEKIFLPLKRLF